MVLLDSVKLSWINSDNPMHPAKTHKKQIDGIQNLIFGSPLSTEIGTMYTHTPNLHLAETAGSKVLNIRHLKPVSLSKMKID